MIASRPDNEAQRLEELRAYAILDTSPEVAFDRVTRMAARIFDAPIVMVSLVDEDRQWFKSCYGLDTRETSRDLAFCAHALLADGALMVPDATLDSRFSDNILVTGSPHIRFYAGAPLISPRGLKLGTLCVIDVRPRKLDATALTTLSELAAIVVDEMGLRVVAQQKITEVEERKRAQDALWAREEYFRNLIENARDIISVLSPEGAILYESPSLEPILGYLPEEVVGRNAFEFIHPDDVSLVREGLEQVVADDAPGPAVEFRFLHQDGSWRWLEAIGSPQWEYSQPDNEESERKKNLVGIVVNSRDVTARKETEAELLDEQERFFKAFDLSPIGIALVAPDGRWLRANRALCEIIGYSRNELLATSFQNITHPDDLTAYLELVKQLLDGKRSCFQLEKRYLHKSGRTIWVLLDASLVRDGNGAPQYFISQVQNMNARKMGEMELRDSQALLKGITEIALDAIVIMDSESRVVEWNPSAERIFGFTREQVLGRDLAEFVLPPDFRQKHHEGLAKYLMTGESATLGHRTEFSALRANATEITIELMSGRLPLEGDPIFALFARDVTHNRNIEERLRRLESVAVSPNDAMLTTESKPLR